MTTAQRYICNLQYVHEPARRSALVFTHQDIGDGNFVEAIREALREYFQWLDGGIPHSLDPEFQRPDTDDFAASNGVLIQIYVLQHWDEPFADLSFGQAIEAMKQGKRVARAGWNGQGMFAYLVPAASYPAQTGVAKQFFGEGALVPYRAYMALKTAQGDVATWAPSGSDALADDWMILD